LETVLGEITVHFEARGSGPYVFLLHGWGSNLTLFNDLAETLSSQYCVVSLDFPGCGGTGEPSEPWGLDDYVKFTSEFISSFDADEIILLGHSHGGRVAIRLATDPDVPFTITKMILVDSAGILPRRSVEYHLRVLSYKAGKALLSWPPVAKAFPEALGALQKALGSSDYSSASPIMRASLVKVVNTDCEPLLPKITAETLIIWGENDEATPVSDGQKMEKAIPGSGLVVLPNAGHYSFIDQEYTFGKVMESFLQIS
jgi:pimeloyl-ACP methyl ester carboxylesterase